MALSLATKPSPFSPSSSASSSHDRITGASRSVSASSPIDSSIANCPDSSCNLAQFAAVRCLAISCDSSPGESRARSISRSWWLNSSTSSGESASSSSSCRCFRICCRRCQTPPTASSFSRWPPYKSTSRNCCDGCSSDWFSLAPWMSISRSPTVFSSAAVTGEPLMKARLPPAVITRRSRIRHSSHGGNAHSSNLAASHPRTPGYSGGRCSTAATSQPDAPRRIADADARPPESSCKAPITSDLPAPVSPVTVLKPAPKSICNSGTSTRSLMYSDSISA